MKRSVTFAIAMAVALFTSTSSKAADLVDTTVAAGNFRTLAAALEAADLVKALQSDGPFTVFAPTDEAFAKLPAGTVESLLKPENKAKLQAILTHHVVASQVPASKVVTLSGATTLGGQRVDIRTDDSGVTVDGAKLVQTDIACDNGLIHVIDTVLLPAEKDLVETAAAAGTFEMLIAAAKAAGLAGALTGSDDLTVFAPTDKAFERLPEGAVDSLLKPENQQQLVSILKYHVVGGRVYSDTALAAGSAKTLQGGPLTITADSDGARVNDAKLLATDLDASNGVIHVIDTVLMPPATSAGARCHREVCQTLAAAIAKGAPMFNAGHHAACADLYMKTMSGLMDSELDGSMKQHVSTVINAARHQHRSTDRAWTLRRGMDQMFVTLQQSN